MALLFANNAFSTLVNAIASNATTLFVQNVDAGLFPVLSTAGDYFSLTLEDRRVVPIQREIVKVTARSGNVMTVTRAQEGTSAQGFAAGATAANRLTAGSIKTVVAASLPPVSLYLGAFATAPTTMPDGTSLQLGALYYNTANLALFEFGLSEVWTAITPNSGTLSQNLYLGPFSTAPLATPSGGPLIAGMTYYNTVDHQLYAYTGTAWVLANSSTTQTLHGSQYIDGDLVVSGNITAGKTIAGPTMRADTMYLGGNLLVDVGDISGTSFSQKFPDGTIMRWGESGTGSGTVTITFDAPFASGVRSILVTGLNNSGVPGIYGATFVVSNITTSSFKVSSFVGLTPGVAGGFAFSWLAFGQ